MFKSYSSSSSLVITSRWFVTSCLAVPASVRLVYFAHLYWYLQIRSQFCTWLGNRIIVLWIKARTNCIIRITEISVHKIWIMSSYIITSGLYEPLVCPVKLLFDTSHFGELFEAWKIVQHNFSQFWTVFPSFGREKLGKTGLSQFIPFWTGKTGFGREKPNLDIYNTHSKLCL